MEKVTYNKLIDFRPCYSSETVGMPTDYEDTVLNFIKEYYTKVKSPDDIFWVVCRKEFIDAKTLRLFACWCAREALKLVKNPDSRSMNAVDVSEKFANGKANKEELNAAESAAKSAAKSAAESAQINKLIEMLEITGEY